jgi:hypothetical protein
MDEEIITVEVEEVDGIGTFNETGDFVTPVAHGAGYQRDPRQQITWDNYVQTVIAGAGDVYNSALKAGYTRSTAEKVYEMKWFKDRKKKLSRNGMLTRAEKNLDDVLKMKYTKMVKNKEGDVEEVTDTDILKIVVDVSKSMVKSLGKDEGYSDRSELTGKGGEPIVFLPLELLEKHNLTSTPEEQTKGR